MEEDREYKDTVQKLFTFIEESPSQYHAVDTMKKHLEAAGYEQLLESGAWKLKSGGKYYVIRSGSSLTVSYTHLDVYKRQLLWLVRTGGNDRC